MLTNLKSAKFARNIKLSFWYFGASFIQLVVSLVTTPLYAANMEASDFALIGYFLSIQAFLFPFFSFSFYSYYIMNYFRNTEEENNRILTSLILFLIISNVIVSIIAYFAIYAYFVFYQVNFPHFPFTIFILLTLFSEMFKTFLLVKYRMEKQGKKYFFISLLKIVLNALFCVSFVVGFQWRAAGRMGGTLLSSVIVGLISLYFLKNYFAIKSRIDFKIIKDAIKTTYPLVLASLFYFPINGIDKLYLERTGKIENLGLYTIGLTISNHINIMQMAVTQAFEPDIYKNIINHNKKKLIKIFSVLVATMVLILGSFGLLSKPIIHILTAGRYTSAYIYANLNLLPLFGMFLYGIMQKIMLVKKKTKQILITEIIGGISSLVLVKIFILKWSFEGALYAKTLVSILMVIMGFIFLKIHKNVKE